MKKVIFKGCGTAIATPFNESGINYEVFKKHIEDQINDGVDSIIVCGTTGEASTMTEAERKDVIKFVVDTVNKRIPVIAGTGSNNTEAVIQMTKYAESVGVDGALIVTPYYNKTTQNGLIEHYKSISNSVSIPIILYNVPSRTGMNISPETCLELSKIENIVGIKEASGNISQITRIASLCGDNLLIYSGNDDQILPILSLGGQGVISVLSNINPSLTLDITNSFFAGNLADSLKYQLKALPIINALFEETNPIPVKEALNLLGFNFGEPRLPLIKCSDNLRNKLKALIK